MLDFWDVISSLPTIINAEATWNFTAEEICSLSAEQKPVDPGDAVYILGMKCNPVI